MRILIAVLGFLLAVTVAPQAVSAGTYVDTAGQTISEEQLGVYCRPTEKLADGKLMIYSTSDSDVRLLQARMIESGVTDEPTLQKWQQLAQANDCTSRAGLNCSGGKCSSGSCQSEVKAGFTGCVCK